MALNKVFGSAQEAIADVYDGCTIMFGHFGAGGPPGYGGTVSGFPAHLALALREKGTKNITAISHAVGGQRPDRLDLSLLIETRQIRKVVCSLPVLTGFRKLTPFEEQYLRGEIELELVPQGTLAERIRAGGAGIGGFYTPTGVGTEIEEGKEKRVINGRGYILELPLKADFAFIRAHKADRMGNLVYRKAGRSFNPLVAAAAKVTIVEVDEPILEVGELDPEVIVTPGIYVDRLVHLPEEAKK